MPSPLLSARNLSKTFHVPGGALHAVSDVSFDVFPNETLALVGESGCGKSTLSRVLLHLEKPEAGSIIFEGKDITHVPHKDLREVRLQMQYIFQDPYSSLNPRMSVRGIIAEPLVINNIGTPSEREYTVDSLLALVGLQQKDADLFPHQFSGGQRQRIAIARALVLNPKLVICDEPVSALDVSMQAQILNLLQDLQNRLRLSYLFISHNLAVVHYISRRVMIMFLGKICEIADTETIFSKPRHPYTNFLLAATPPIDPTRRDEKKMFLQGEIPSPLHLPTGCLFHTRCPYAKEICTTTAPALVHDEARGASFACHFPLN